MVAVYQGAKGAYSQLVVEDYLRKHGLAPASNGVASYRDVALALAGARADVGVLPVENAIGGTVREAYDLMAEFKLAPVAEVLWGTNHRLLGVPGASLGDVREVLAHPLVLAECGKFLSTLLHARTVPCEDTGIAAREVARAGSTSLAALAPSAAAVAYNLVELAVDCSDSPYAYSRFLVVRAAQAVANGAPPAFPAPGERKTSLLFSLPDAPGSIARCLAHLAERGINVTKIESKPRVRDRSGHDFYVDCDGDVADAALAAALVAMERDSETFVLLGSYEKHLGPPLAPSERRPETAFEPLPPNVRARDVAPPADAGLPRVSRLARANGSMIHVGAVRVGDGEFTVIAGPCSVESREQILATAEAVRAGGAVMLRGGAFKPRTSPYAFQGLGWEGVALLAEAGRASGLPTVSEVMTIDQVERMANQIDVLQIGARNMQNFDLLRAVGRTQHPVLLKRGLSATLDELLAAAEYILAEGNPNVILCERGIRTFEPATRNTLDLSAVPVLRERSHLPVLVDPSHGVGVRRWVRPLCRAAKAAGAHGLLIEVHPNPPEAKSDKDQALTFEDFAQVVADLREIPNEWDPVAGEAPGRAVW